MTYTHKVHYYETDAQGVTHHSNYIRIMEETRVYAMEQMGFSYERMEREGNYERPTTFADIIEVQISVAELSQLKAKFAYTMTSNGKIVCQATSLHCFLNSEGRPLVIADRFPEFYKALSELVV